MTIIIMKIIIITFNNYSKRDNFDNIFENSSDSDNEPLDKRKEKLKNKNKKIKIKK